MAQPNSQYFILCLPIQSRTRPLSMWTGFATCSLKKHWSSYCLYLSHGPTFLPTPPIPVVESFRGKWYTYTLTHKNTVLKTKFRSFSVFQNDSNLYLCVTVPYTCVPRSQGNLPRSPGRADALCYGLCPGTALGCPPPSIHTSAPCVDCRRELPKERISFTLHSRCPAGVWHIIHTRWTS